MSMDPDIDGVQTQPGVQKFSHMYGSEYTGNLNDQNVPCQGRRKHISSGQAIQ